MKKIQKSLLIFLFLLSITIGLCCFSRNSKRVNSISNIGQEFKDDSHADSDIQKTDLKKIEEKIEIKKQDEVSIVVLNKKYTTSIEKDDTVYSVMQKLQNRKENNFSFGYKEYPSLGIFINEINGVKGEPTKYWIYYVNGIEASAGVSKNIIKNGDIINWKQE